MSNEVKGLITVKGSEIEKELQDMANATATATNNVKLPYPKWLDEAVENLWDNGSDEDKQKIAELLQPTLQQWASYQSYRSYYIVPENELLSEYNFYLCRMLELDGFPDSWNYCRNKSFLYNLYIQLCSAKSITLNLFRKYKRIYDHELPLNLEDNSHLATHLGAVEMPTADIEFLTDLQNLKGISPEDKQVLIGLATGQIEKKDIPTVLNWSNKTDRKKLSRYMKALADKLQQLLKIGNLL